MGTHPLVAQHRIQAVLRIVPPISSIIRNKSSHVKFQGARDCPRDLPAVRRIRVKSLQVQNEHVGEGVHGELLRRTRLELAPSINGWQDSEFGGELLGGKCHELAHAVHHPHRLVRLEGGGGV